MTAARRVLLAALSAALLWAAQPALGAEVGILPENPLAGRALFASKRCIRCHSIQGVGGRTGPDLGEVALGSFNAITSSLWNHFPRMIEAFAKERLQWPRLSAEEAQSLVTFLYFLNYLDKAASPALGERIFQEKNCIRCHSVGGKGGEIGPALDPYQTKYAAPFITAALWNNGPKMMQTMQKEKVPRPQFQERDVMDILAFIRARGLSKATKRNYLRPANPVNGQALFQSKNCVRCHAVQGQGGKIGPDLARSNLKGSLSSILAVMWNHGSNMWPRMSRERIPFPEFSPEEMSDLLAYLYFLQFQEPTGNAGVGARVFGDKRCKGCHVPEKSYERAIAPNLAQAGLDSPFKIIAEMWNHAPKIAAKMKENNIRWPIVDKEEMRNLIAYLMSLE